MHYARAIDDTLLIAIRTIASQQAEATEAKMKQVMHLFDFLATQLDAAVRFMHQTCSRIFTQMYHTFWNPRLEKDL